MIDIKYCEDIAHKLFAILPDGLKNIEQDMQQKFKEVLQAAFARLDLVTREEFDVQTKVLARTREKLEALQVQINKLAAQ